jgi:hypothetical protein
MVWVVLLPNFSYYNQYTFIAHVVYKMYMYNCMYNCT